MLRLGTCRARPITFIRGQVTQVRPSIFLECDPVLSGPVKLAYNGVRSEVFKWECLSPNKTSHMFADYTEHLVSSKYPNRTLSASLDYVRCFYFTTNYVATSYVKGILHTSKVYGSIYHHMISNSSESLGCQ